MIAIRWIECPPEVESAMGPLLDRWAELLPTWCQRFEVRYDPRRRANLAANLNFRNRWGQLLVTGEWLDEDSEEREVALLHELIHVGLEPVGDAATKVVNKLTEEGTPSRGLAATMIEDGLEGSVEDLARALLRLRRAGTIR